MDFLSGLNPQQRQAVLHVEGPLLLLAGAGSGKTRVITHRMAHLITEHRVPGPCVLAVTFTNKAAGEMRERVMSLIGETSTRMSPVVSTFHSFCVRLLRRDGKSLAEVRPGFTPQFNIYDDDDQLAVVKAVYRHLGLDDKFLQYRAALSIISTAKNKKEGPEDFYKNAKDPKGQRLAVIFEQYEGRLKQANALDFDDLLLESVRLLRTDQGVRELYNRRFEFVMIDEYQDTNRSQYELMRLLTEARGNVCVVGDEDQSIYGWRGADIKNILDFQRDYPRATVIRLEQNYRSMKNILDAAGAVVENNKSRLGKTLWTDAGAGEKVTLYEAMDGESEALFIADQIEREFQKNSQTRVAVLYRTNSQSRQVEEALRRYNRKYVVIGGLSFYERAEVKDLLSYLKTLVNPNDSISLMRIFNTPARGIGKTTIEQVEKFAASRGMSLWQAVGAMLDERQLPMRAEAAVAAFRKLIEDLRDGLAERPVDETLARILEETGYRKMLEAEQTPESESRMGNITELVNAAADGSERGETIEDFLDHAALVAQADDLDERAQVSLLTMHNAKGLEWPVVFIAGLEEGLFPHSRARDNVENLEEERRLCYVALTRAQKKLYLTWARYRRRYGGGSPEATLPSRFLTEIPKELTERRFEGRPTPQVDLYSERSEVRESSRKNLFTGKTYNSVENITQFFGERGMPAPQGLRKPDAKPAPAASSSGDEDRAPWDDSPAEPAAAAQSVPFQARPPQLHSAQAHSAQPYSSPAQSKPGGPSTQLPFRSPSGGHLAGGPVSGGSASVRPSSVEPGKPVFGTRPSAGGSFAGAKPKSGGGVRAGSVVSHPKYGRGTVMRREGEGEDARLTISFPGHGLKKIIEKFAGLKIES